MDISVFNKFKMTQIYCIDGNIGAGKSCLLEELGRRGYDVYQEELTGWGWCLAEYYKDQKRWAFTLQMAILQSMTDRFAKIRKSGLPIVFVERSPEAGVLFTQNSFFNGNLTENELDLYQKMYNGVNWGSYVVVKLSTPVEECFERIKKRNRACENTMTIEYVSHLDTLYSKMDCVSVDGTQSSIELANSIEDLLNKNIK